MVRAVRDLVFVKATQNTYRFGPSASDAQPPVLKQAYVERWLFGDNQPKMLRVILEIPDTPLAQPPAELGNDVE